MTGAKMEKSQQQMGAGQGPDRQQGGAAKKRDPRKPAQPQTQQAGSGSDQGQMQSTQFTDWASI